MVEGASPPAAAKVVDETSAVVVDAASADAVVAVATVVVGTADVDVAADVKRKPLPGAGVVDEGATVV